MPGDALYGVKLGLERALLVLVSPSYAAQGTLQVKYTERRMAEAKQLLANRHSIEGLTYLKQQVVDTKSSIDSAPNRAAQVQLAQTYIQTLKNVSSELEEQKQTAASAPIATQQQPYRAGSATVVATPTPTTRPTATPTPTPVASRQGGYPPTTPPPVPTTPTPTPTPLATPVVTQPPAVAAPPSNVAVEIENTQQNIEETIKELEEITRGTAQSESVHERNDQRKQEQNQGGNSAGNQNRGRGNR